MTEWKETTQLSLSHNKKTLLLLLTESLEETYTDLDIEFQTLMVGVIGVKYHTYQHFQSQNLLLNLNL